MPEQDIDMIGIGALNYDYIVRWSDIPGSLRATLQDLVKDNESITSDVHAFTNSLDAAIDSTAQVATDHGGSAFNVVRAMAHMGTGLKLGYVGILGLAPRLPDRFDFVKYAKALGVSRRFMHLSSIATATLSYVSDNGERDLFTLFSDKAANAIWRASQDGAVIKYLARARHLHITSVFGQDASQAILNMLEKAQDYASHSISISFDPGLTWAHFSLTDPAISKIISLSNLIFVNEAELRALGAPATSVATAGKNIALKQRESRQVVLLKESHQAKVFCGEPPLDHSIDQRVLPTSRIADSTGAGDVFAAGVLASRLSERGQVLSGTMMGLCAARHKMQFVGENGYAALSTLFTPAAQRVKQTVFLSHSKENAELAESFVTFLEGMGSDRTTFCTSVLDTGIPVGAEFIPAIYQSLSDSVLVIFLVTLEFCKSRFCSYEVGASWALGKEQIGLYHGVNPSRLDPMLSQRQMASLSSAEGLALVVRRLRQLRILKAANTPERDHRQIKLFLRNLQDT